MHTGCLIEYQGDLGDLVGCATWQDDVSLDIRDGGEVVLGKGNTC